VEHYKKAADQGLEFAQYNLALSYYYGRGVEKSLVKAAEYHRKAAEKGYTLAQYELAQLYLSGEGVEEDPIQAGYNNDEIESLTLLDIGTNVVATMDMISHCICMAHC
jgi:TPR repeat protein